VVYIEDSASNLDLVARVLETTGRYEVIGALDGEIGMEVVARELPAVVLLDLDVPTVNGFEVMRQLRRSKDPLVARIPVIVVSANVMANERDVARELGCAAFIEKPFDIRQFREQIERVVHGTNDVVEPRL